MSSLSIEDSQECSRTGMPSFDTLLGSAPLVMAISRHAACLWVGAIQ